jgi:hypothetical protein
LVNYPNQKSTTDSAEEPQISSGTTKTKPGSSNGDFVNAVLKEAEEKTTRQLSSGEVAKRLIKSSRKNAKRNV